MSRMLVLPAALAALAFVPVLPLAAQQGRPGLVEVRGQERGGFWLSAGLGAGVERVNLDGDGRGYSDALTKPTFSLRLGGTPSETVRLGAEFFVWVNERGDAVETLSSAQFVAHVFPVRTSGLNLRGGVGLARSAVTYDFFGEVGETGFGASVGAGWEIPVGRKLALVPSVDVHQQWYDGPDGFTERIVNIGLSVQFQTGR